MWLTDPSELFSSWEIIPSAGDGASETANKLTRFLLFVSLIVWYKNTDKLKDVILYGLLTILTIYAIMIDREKALSKKEKFSPITYKMNSSPENQDIKLDTPTVLSIPVERPSSSTPITALQSAHLLQPDQPSAAALQLPLSVPSMNPMMRQDLLQVAPRPPQQNFTPNLGINAKVYQAVRLPPRLMDSDFSDIQTNQPVDFNPLQDLGQGDERRRYEPKRNNSLLLERTEDDTPPMIPAQRVASGNNRFYLQDIQPNVYSFSYDPTPINSNIGITYTPQIPPRTTRVMCTEDGQTYPLYTRVDNAGALMDRANPEYTRIDPQLIRDNVPPQRMEELPPRGQWSAKPSQYEAASSGINGQIYDPRFTGYGDAYRGYQDIELGNVKYYYTDVDAYRTPNFVIRNKVDHVDLQQPMGDIYSTYPREAALEDVRDIVNNDWMAKSTEFREDLMERQMRKSNARQWQLRFAPRSKGAHLSTFTSGY
jgi:hypothetical protein